MRAMIAPKLGRMAKGPISGDFAISFRKEFANTFRSNGASAAGAPSAAARVGGRRRGAGEHDFIYSQMSSKFWAGLIVRVRPRRVAPRGPRACARSLLRLPLSPTRATVCTADAKAEPRVGCGLTESS